MGVQQETALIPPQHLAGCQTRDEFLIGAWTLIGPASLSPGKRSFSEADAQQLCVALRFGGQMLLTLQSAAKQVNEPVEILR